MRRRQKQHSEGPGQDSFLDIVANLVGILIILVIVVGVRAKDAMLQAETEKIAKASEKIDVATPTQAAQALVNGINQIQTQINQGLLETEFRKRERDKMLKLVSLAERELETKQRKLDKQQQQQLAIAQRVDQAQAELDRLSRQRKSLELESAPTTELKHIPTPLAKTVFGKEVHFRLQNHKIAFVPWDTLVDQFKKQAPENFWKLKQSPEFTEVIGPVQGFRLKYTIAKRQVAVSAGGGRVMQTLAALDHFLIIPTDPNAGDPVARALQPGSQMHTILQSLHPDRVTLTIWVYPESFEDYRRLRQQLIERGFITAGRPMPAHRHIGGAPNGSRSLAQ